MFLSLPCDVDASGDGLAMPRHDGPGRPYRHDTSAKPPAMPRERGGEKDDADFDCRSPRFHAGAMRAGAMMKMPPAFSGAAVTPSYGDCHAIGHWLPLHLGDAQGAMPASEMARRHTHGMSPATPMLPRWAYHLLRRHEKAQAPSAMEQAMPFSPHFADTMPSRRAELDARHCLSMPRRDDTQARLRCDISPRVLINTGFQKIR